MSDEHTLPEDAPTPRTQDPQAADPRAGAQPPVRRAVAVRTVLTRLGSAAVVLALTAMATVLGAEVPPTRPTPVGADQVTVPASSTTQVCPGPLRVPTELEPGDDAAYDPEFDPTPGETQTSVVVLDGEEADLGSLGGDGAPVERHVRTYRDVDAAHVLAVPPRDDGTPGPTTAAFGARTREGDLRGLAAAACQAPLAESWLVGGATTLGSSARLVLANPGRTAATVTVDVWGATGPLDDGRTLQYLVPPGSERVVLLEGVAPEEARVVVRLRSAGGLVAGHLQVSELRGLVPAGVDLVVPSGAPATRQVIPGVVLLEAAPGSADAAQLRLLAPDGDARARVRLLGPAGEVELPGAQDVPLVAGEVLDVPLTGVPDGAWAVVVEADAPVVAGALLTTGPGVGTPEDEAVTRPREIAWAPSLRGTVATSVALPRPGWPFLTVVSTADEAVTVPVTVVMPDGSEHALSPVRVPGTSTRTVGLRLEGDDRMPVGVRLGDGEPLPEGVAWAAFVRGETGDGAMLSVLSPTPRTEAPPQVAVVVE